MFGQDYRRTRTSLVLFSSSCLPLLPLPRGFPFSLSLTLPASGHLLLLWASCLGRPGRRDVAHRTFFPCPCHTSLTFPVRQ